MCNQCSAYLAKQAHRAQSSPAIKACDGRTTSDGSTACDGSTTCDGSASGDDRHWPGYEQESAIMCQRWFRHPPFPKHAQHSQWSC